MYGTCFHITDKEEEDAMQVKGYRVAIAETLTGEGGLEELLTDFFPTYIFRYKYCSQTQQILHYLKIPSS